MTIVAASDLGSQPIEADLAVFGGGPAGISLALSAQRRGVTVVLVESGGNVDDPEWQNLFDGRSIGEAMTPRMGRHRVLGGASSRWSGRCGKLDPIDYDARSWMPDSGWPHIAAELDRTYPLAAQLCGFPQKWDVTPDWFETLQRLPGKPDDIDPFL